MQTGHELFVHEMQDMLDAENKLVEALGEQAEESSNPQVKKAFEAHQRQTEKQVQRLEQAFENIGEEAEETECKGIKGLIEEHDHFKEEEEPAADILDIFNVAAAIKVERYEITGYESLIRMAQMMGHKKAVQLLTQNLKEEQATLKKMDGFSKKLKPEQMGMEEEEEQGARRGASRSSGSRRRAA